MLLTYPQSSLQGFRIQKSTRSTRKIAILFLRHPQSSLQGFRNLNKQQIHMKNGFYVSNTSLVQFTRLQEFKEVTDPPEKSFFTFNTSLEQFARLQELKKQQIQQKNGDFVSKTYLEQFSRLQELREVADPIRKMVFMFLTHSWSSLEGFRNLEK